MSVTIAAVMRHIRNYFQQGSYTGTIAIHGGVVTPAVSTPYVCIYGSAHSDGVYAVENGAITGVEDETFTGRVWFLKPPADFLSLVEQITAYEAQNAPSPLLSESLGEYSYTRAQGKSGGFLTWEEAFATRLAPYRRMFTEVIA